MWYNARKGVISPILSFTITAPDWKAILLSGKVNSVPESGDVMAAGELKYGKGVFRIYELQLSDRMGTNPAAQIFTGKLVAKSP
jgi:hypothetical protein